jgi:branched-chain amino acid transport system permease protein
VADTRTNPILVGVILLGLVAVPLVVRNDYFLHLFIVSAIFALLAQGLNLIVGYVGQLSLAHGAFFALGAYASALAFTRLKWSMWIGLPLAIVVTAVIAFLLGWVILRVRGHRFVIITVAFAEIMKLAAVNWVDFTRGFMGLPGLQVPTLDLPGLGAVDLGTKQNFYYLALVAALVGYVICARLVRSDTGRQFVLVRENEVLAESLGISAFRYCMIAFVVGAAMAGAAGALYGHYTGFVSPDLFNFSYVTIMLIMVILGGKGTLIGPVLGAVLFTFLPELLREASHYRMLIFATILIVATLFMPRGIIFPVVEQLIPYLSRLRHGRAA